MSNTFDSIISGSVLTMARNRPYAEAVGIKDGVIAAVGDRRSIRRSTGSGTRRLDLDGKFILPGLMDTHVHLIEAGTVERHLDLSGATAVSDILAAVAGKAGRTPAGEPVLAFNFNYDVVREGRLPTMAELDGASPDHPAAVIVYDIHSARLNSLMLERLAPLPQGPGVGKDAGGNPTGLLEDPAIARLMGYIQPEGPGRIGEAVDAAIRQALRRGVTSLHVKEPPPGIEAISAMGGKLPIRVKPMIKVKSDDLAGYDALLNSDIAASGAVIAIYADGAPDSGTAAFFEPYLADPSNFGMLYHEDEQLEELVGKAHRRGFQVSVHTCGTRATEQVLTVYEKILSAHPRPDHRHRIEHFEMPFGHQIRRAVDAGIALAMQPAFLFLSGEGTFENMRALLGAERTMRWKPFRSVLDAGGLVAGGSDAPVTPLGPLKGIEACVNHPNPAERITRFEALRMFTLSAARMGFEEGIKGTVEPGKLADFTVLAENPFLVDSDGIGSIPVEMTIVGGRVVYEA